MTSPQEIFLKDYTPSSFAITSVHLDVDIFDEHTVVKNTSVFIRNEKSEETKETSNTLELDGVDLDVISVVLNGEEINDYEKTSTKLILKNIPESFTLETTVKINPASNKQLMGLYMSDGIYCTQNEPEGFRRITYHLDRPDVMSMYSCTLSADKTKYPILLSNGNPSEVKELEENLENNRHSITWIDPFKKPCYLFALVAGDLVLTESEFTTMNGKAVPLRIYTDKGNETRVNHAMESLKKAMKWDEERFGREYDLDIFMIVAVDAFNAGAMENKGLNIFNSSAILCDQKSATDNDFRYIEAVVAHEYFHNWTGNRITCRDWFQLTLKEGLTVFRDAEFSADMGDKTVKRIEDAQYMQEGQFAEDAGPMAHPIQPQSFMEIENFYTVTVYEKGSEVIRMLQTMYGKDAFRKAMDLYFETFDGQAVTVDEFLWSFETALSIDLTQFKKSWYLQAGTPTVTVTTEYNTDEKTYSLHLKQSCNFPKSEETLEKNAEEKTPYYFPFAIGLLDKYGQEIKDQMHLMSKKEETVVFNDIASKPIPSLLRNFSAPVKIEYEYSMQENLFLFANDTDEYNRYLAGQRVAIDIITQIMNGTIESLPIEVIQAYKSLLENKKISAHFKAKCLSFPALFSLVSPNETYDYKKAYAAKKKYISTLSNSLTQEIVSVYHDNQNSVYSLSDTSIGERELKNAALCLLSENEQDFTSTLSTQFETANNMTDRIIAFSLLCKKETPAKNNAIFDFENQWKNDPLVMNKWFAVQASTPNENILEIIKTLETHESFDLTNPNKIRCLFGAFARNSAFFHAADGKNYDYIADKIIEIDTFNNKASSGLCQVFRQYSKMPLENKTAMKTALLKVSKTENISDALYEVVTKILKSGE